MSDKILGMCKLTIAHGQGIHEEVIGKRSRLVVMPCEDFKVVPANIIWASTERFRDILRECFNVHGETGSWESVPEIMRREKSKFERLESKFTTAKEALTEHLKENKTLKAELAATKEELRAVRRFYDPTLCKALYKGYARCNSKIGHHPTTKHIAWLGKIGSHETVEFD